MCLYTSYIQPKVADHDIIVCKWLTPSYNCFVTPVMGFSIEFNKEFSAIGFVDIKSNSSDGKYWALSGGAIHASLCNDYYQPFQFSEPFKAIIHKGTHYWVNVYGTEIAAKKMIITDTRYSSKDVDILFWKNILKESPNINNIYIGDYLMTDNTFKHPTEKINQNNVRGIVCGFRVDGTPIICALEIVTKLYNKNSFNTFNHGRYYGGQGKLITEAYIHDKSNSIESFEYCINYRKQHKEAWYFGSIQEVLTMAENSVFLNAAYNITKIGFMYHRNMCFLSCNTKSNISTYRCYLGKFPYIYIEDKSITANLLPFYDYHQVK